MHIYHETLKRLKITVSAQRASLAPTMAMDRAAGPNNIKAEELDTLEEIQQLRIFSL